MYFLFKVIIHHTEQLKSKAKSKKIQQVTVYGVEYLHVGSMQL